MAKGKKGALYQLLVPMVDSTDFASIESAITESDFNSGVTKKFYGCNHGVSTATTSGTISKAGSLVRSGVFRITLKTSENNYDVMMARFNKTGCAEQIFVWENVDNDDSDLMSYLVGLSAAVSDAHSAAILGASTASTAQVQATAAASRVLLVQSRLSDLDSRLASDTSDILSQLLVIQSMASDAHSAAILGASTASLAQVQATAGASRALILQSRLSDLDSRLVSDLSDVYSAAVQANSRVLLVQSLASDAHSAAILGASTASAAGVAATAGASRALIIQSRLSDLDSRLSSDVSDLSSYLVTLSSLTSDAHSAATLGASRALVIQSRLSDLDSRLVSDLSDIRSAISDLHSDLTSQIGTVPGAVWDAVVSDHQTAGTTGELLQDLDDEVDYIHSVVDNIAVTGAALSMDASSFTKTVGGVEVNTYTSTSILDGTCHEIPDVTGQIDCYYEFNVGTSGVPVGVNVTGRLQNTNPVSGNAINLYAYNWGTGWELLQADVFSPTTGSTNSAHSDTLYIRHVGTGADDGKVRIRFYQTGMKSGGTSLKVDQITVDYAESIASAVQAAASRTLLVQSRLSDLDSRLVSDLSDLRSQVSDVHSDLLSYLVGLSGLTSDAHSAAAQGNSRALVLQSRLSDFDSRLVSDISDLRSALSDAHSDLKSAIGGVSVTLTASDISDIASAVAAAVTTVTASDISDIASAVWAHATGARVDSRVLLTQSLASDAHSAAAQANSRVLVGLSRLSDFDSRLVSDVSDLRSQLSDAHSDLRSQISGITTGGVTVSNISDIASAVWANTIGARVDSRVLLTQSAASDAHSAAAQANSRVLVLQSRVSDLDSRLVSDISDIRSALSDAHSDLKSAIGAVTTTIGASELSDIASAVWADAIGARVDSRVRLTQSAASDAASAAQQANSRALVMQSRLSDFDSRLVSDISDVRSQLLVVQSMASDAASAAQQGSSRALVLQSRLSDLDSRLVSDLSDVRSAISDTHSNLASQIAGVTATLSASDISDIASAVWADTIGARVDSRVRLTQSMASDAASAAQQANSRVLINQSRVSDIYSLLSDVSSDLGVMSGVVSDVYSALAAGVDLGASSLSDLRSAITANGVLRVGAEPTAVPAHTGSLAAKVDWLAALAKNKVVQTAALQSVRDAADANTIASATVADDGVSFVRGAFGS